MNELKKRDDECQTSMHHEPINAKMDAWTSIDETLLVLNEEESDSNSNIDEVLNLSSSRTGYHQNHPKPVPQSVFRVKNWMFIETSEKEELL
ncbi:hypothetical protein HNY73_014386 [Argiope bruennichi]|uniref:Uncharacterized protein n=1 Tax=Argiope bruennichi TaxID=94029 RepID=A0A8T0ET50_ARGBR|nr:hypothetical protein HNY73_014386 [Argiope bruennichi]